MLQSLRLLWVHSIAIFIAMGKLNIAHHKSYHPYRLDNIERVRKDEEEARLKEEHEEGRMRLAVSIIIIDLFGRCRHSSSF